MKLVRGAAAALALIALSAPGALGQSLAGGAAGSAQAGFGISLAVGGGELFVGEPNNSARPGLVYVYRRGATGWVEVAQLRAEGATPADGFGQQLLLAGSTLFVGVPARDENRGTVYVFERGANGWAPTGQLSPSDLEPMSRFGASIASDGDEAFVSAPGQQDQSGAVYVFRRGAQGWSQSAKLTLSMPVARSLFGLSLAIAGDRAFIGSPAINQSRGQVTVFARDAQTGEWHETGTLPTSELQPNERFGWSVRAADGTVIVSAPVTDGAVGAAYVYTQSADGSWTQQARLGPVSPVPNSVFGLSLAFDGARLLVGAPGADTARGAVLHFVRSADGSFPEPQRITPAVTLARTSRFGSAVAVVGDVAAVTMAGDDHGAGTVLVFEHANGTWTQSSVLKSPPETLASIVGSEVRCAEDGTAGGFTCGDVELLSFLSIPDLGGSRGVRLNDIWGWTDPQTGREFALVGRIDGMSAVDVSNPSNPVFIADLPLTDGANPASWRDIKTYRDHAYIVADGSGPHGMQVLDLTKLRAFNGTPLKLTADTTYRNINSAHNVVINEESGFAFAVGASQGGETCGGGLHMIDIREPKNPKFAGCFSDPQTGRASTGYSHDAQCVMYRGPDTRYRGREICLGSNETALSIADVTDKENPRALSRASYPNVGYSHQGWLDEEQRYFYMDDELDELNGLTSKTRTLIWDLADLEDPQLVKEHLGVEAASDHNLYIRGDLMYQSNYKSGLRILDISGRENPREVGFFKTFPGADASAGFDGSWSNYPYFRSGIIIVSSIGQGMFVVKKRDTKTVF